MDFTAEDVVDPSGRPCVRLTGSLDLATRGELVRVAELAIATAATGDLVIDMAGVTFMDSTGIGALVRLSKAAKSAGLGFVLDRPSDRTRRILRMTGLESWVGPQPTD